MRKVHDTAKQNAFIIKNVAIFYPPGYNICLRDREDNISTVKMNSAATFSHDDGICSIIGLFQHG